MKSYFAKLAARATLSNLQGPATPSGPATPDPFENTIVTTAPTTRDERAPDWQLTSKPRPDPQVKPVVSEVVDTRTQQKQPGPADLSAAEPLRLTQSPPPSHILEPVRDSDMELSSPVKLEPPAAKDSTQTESPSIQKLIPVVEDLPVHADRRSESDQDDKNDAQSAALKETLDEMRDEQAVLLHKADTFMEQLFANRAQPVEREIEDESERLVVVPNKTEEAPSRLSPPAPAQRTPEPAEDRPALVIGQLTVEVVPPAPAPAPPAPVIVFRSGGGNRRSFLTSRRFGLGQF